jgi:hypothetical protein
LLVEVAVELMMEVVVLVEDLEKVDVDPLLPTLIHRWEQQV